MHTVRFISSEPAIFPGPVARDSLDRIREYLCLEVWPKGISAGFAPDRPVKAIFFDMDGTLIVQETIVEIAKELGKGDEMCRLTEDAMSRGLDFTRSIRSRVALLEGAPSQVLESVYGKLQLQPGLERFVARARQAGLKLYLVSGGFHEVADRLADRLGFHGVLANRLRISDGRLTGELLGPIVDGASKAQYVQEVAQTKGWSHAQIGAIGDGSNDRLMMDQVGLAVGFAPRPILYQHLTLANFSGDYDFLESIVQN